MTQRIGLYEPDLSVRFSDGTVLRVTAYPDDFDTSIEQMVEVQITLTATTLSGIGCEIMKVAE